MVSRHRAAHIERMEEDAVNFAKIYALDLQRLLVCVDSHDLFRDVLPQKLIRIAKVWNLDVTPVEKFSPLLLHGKVAAEYIKRRFGINDKEILDAVAYHTSGIPTESPIVMAMFILDSTESGRDFEGIEELREISAKSLKEGFEAIVKNKLIYAVTNNLLVLPETVETWNYIRGVKS
ncbi:HAD superfamily Hydrolase YqeK [Athalassotoga saccharophila]|nr:HAD superfamily Hydrolase YqeK [Athalassotoga saccharophila]